MLFKDGKRRETKTTAVCIWKYLEMKKYMILNALYMTQLSWIILVIFKLLPVKFCFLKRNDLRIYTYFEKVLSLPFTYCIIDHMATATTCYCSIHTFKKVKVNWSYVMGLYEYVIKMLTVSLVYLFMVVAFCHRFLGTAAVYFKVLLEACEHSSTSNQCLLSCQRPGSLGWLLE